ncbi:DUF2919 domain-containing protein [Vibrio palustris]|uniref:Inner membrane protein YfeZ n=1 Tax=Vibrio palustris TaxID=1918946 RepID=A0A1R4B0B1_9VIBR|nr:DUF2919 domain-containing protein [Vibrio palustris]SJL82327.1 Inner membrane protein YfeZ [Vibrio palustris]
MRYSLEDYDQHGFLKTPIWLWLTWFWLSKAWLVFVMAGATRHNGVDILAFCYPQRSHFYAELALGLPAVIMMWCLHLRHPERVIMTQWIHRLTRKVTLLSLIAQASLGVYYVILQHGKFEWFNGISLLFLLWMVLYVCNSRRLSVCFQMNNNHQVISPSGDTLIDSKD